MTPEQIVQRFCAAAARRDVTELGAYFTEDAVYHNIPIAPVTGRAAIEATLAQFLGSATSCEFEMRAIAANGNVVLTERVDRFVLGGKSIALPVMGTFEITTDGKISAWRDYFDMQQFTSQMA
ncbi:nuclear transport factor 2 family protein [Candidatus Binatia bacterium]|nr:nuclear transport factor 2 family protein [Candidatus Binatia bacterium]